MIISSLINNITLIIGEPELRGAYFKKPYVIEKLGIAVHNELDRR